ncbi:MAG TPA: LysE family translocator [Nevskiaceae bacterium]|nr:LysE family translocator [Nevskiaceae bacterium]
MTTVYSLTPGPAVMLVVSQAMTYGERAALRGIAGIMVMNLAYCVLAALGLGIVVQAFPTAFQAVQWIGAGYLVWIAIQTIRNPVTAQRLEAAAAHPARRRMFWDAVVVQASNPKSILYLAAFLPQFVDPAKGSVGAQMGVLCLLGTIVDFPVLAMYGWIGGRAVRLVTEPRAAKAFAWAAGLLLLGAAAGIAGFGS